MTLNYHAYIQYVRRCPVCGKYGALRAWWSREKPTHRWSGPYFSVQHILSWHDRVKYRKLCETMTRREAHKKATSSAYQYSCYFGKMSPVEVIHPERLVTP